MLFVVNVNEVILLFIMVSQYIVISFYVRYYVEGNHIYIDWLIVIFEIL